MSRHREAGCGAAGTGSERHGRPRPRGDEVPDDPLAGETSRKLRQQKLRLRARDVRASGRDATGRDCVCVCYSFPLPPTAPPHSRYGIYMYTYEWGESGCARDLGNMAEERCI